MNAFMNGALTRRSIQNAEEREIDTGLRFLSCEKTVIEYYVLYREWNRTAFSAAHKDFWNYKKHANDNLAQISGHHEEMHVALNSQDPCKALSAINKRLRADHSILLR